MKNNNNKSECHIFKNPRDLTWNSCLTVSTLSVGVCGPPTLCVFDGEALCGWSTAEAVPGMGSSSSESGSGVGLISSRPVLGGRGVRTAAEEGGIGDS